MNIINKKEYSEKVNDFYIFCIEAYKFKKNISGKEAYDIFEKYKVFEYLEEGYDVLHTQGVEWLLDDINEYINIRNK